MLDLLWRLVGLGEIQLRYLHFSNARFIRAILEAAAFERCAKEESLIVASRRKEGSDDPFGVITGV